MASEARSMTFEAAMDRLIREDAIGQLRRREGEMARLGAEDGALKLDWVGIVPWLLDNSAALAEVEREAQRLLARGVKHVIWAGMGGSVLSVQVMRALGFTGAPCAIHPLDSTDPAALNAVWRATSGAQDTVMIAVAMGMTSEEPISHLEWFASAIPQDASGADKRMVMALPDSYLDRYAREHGLDRLPLQLDGGSGTGGRMSAPGTRVFLLPAALYLAGQGAPAGALASVLRAAWAAYDLDRADADPRASQWVQFACALAAAASDGVVRLVIDAAPGWSSIGDWAEQLMEESLGKGSRGVVIFEPGAAPASAPATVHLRITDETSKSQAIGPGEAVIVEPRIASPDGAERLAGLASLYLGLQLTMALYGYLWAIPFAGQPAVEAYKSRARALRDGPGKDLGREMFETTSMRWGDLAMATPPGPALTGSGTFPHQLATWLRAWRVQRPLAYLDLTINGEYAGGWAALERHLWSLASVRLAIPYKLRRAPAAYHSTEQSEMDGPPDVVSIRAVPLRHAMVEAGAYSARFLEAQALATWQAMNAQGRPCFLSLYDGDTAAMVEALKGLLDAVAAALDAS